MFFFFSTYIYSQEEFFGSEIFQSQNSQLRCRATSNDHTVSIKMIETPEDATFAQTIRGNKKAYETIGTGQYVLSGDALAARIEAYKQKVASHIPICTPFIIFEGGERVGMFVFEPGDWEQEDWLELSYIIDPKHQAKGIWQRTFPIMVKIGKEIIRIAHLQKSETEERKKGFLIAGKAPQGIELICPVRDSIFAHLRREGFVPDDRYNPITTIKTTVELDANTLSRETIFSIMVAHLQKTGGSFVDFTHKDLTLRYIPGHVFEGQRTSWILRVSA